LRICSGIERELRATGTRTNDMRREVTVFSALFLLAVPGDGCDQRSEESTKVVAVDLTRLHLGETNTPLPSQILLLPVRSVRALPESVMSRFPEMSSAGGPFAAGDSVFDDPDRRLIFGGISDQFCLGITSMADGHMDT